MEDPCKNCALRGERNRFMRCNRDRALETTPDSFASSGGVITNDDLWDVREVLHTIIESSADCILVWDREYNYLYANQAAIDHVNTTADKVIGKNIRDGLGHVPDFMHLWMSRIDKVFESGQPMQVADAVPIDGKLVHSESVLSPVHHPDGSIYAVSVVYRDVTEPKTLERELKDSEQKYKDLYNHAQVPLYRTRLSDGKMLECNLAMAEMLGYSSKDECLEKCYATDHYVNPDFRNEVLKKFKAEKEIKGLQIEFRRLNGARGWAEITAKLDPESNCIEGVQYDITAAKLLSPMEQQVLKVMMQGLCNKEIAKELKRSVRTIEGHRQHIMQKLGVDNIIDLTHIAQFLVYASEKS